MKSRPKGAGSSFEVPFTGQGFTLTLWSTFLVIVNDLGNFKFCIGALFIIYSTCILVRDISYRPNARAMIARTTVQRPARANMIARHVCVR